TTSPPPAAAGERRGKAAEADKGAAPSPKSAPPPPPPPPPPPSNGPPPPPPEAKHVKLATPKVSERRGISIVWLVPLLALAIGGYLAYTAYSERGPLVRIHFETAAGVTADKTEVRYRDVVVGKVESVSVNDTLDGVVVEARMDKEAGRYLHEGTDFWIEQPTITASEVSGLQTLLSGVFIGIDPSTDGAVRHEFTGLARKPIVQSSDPGTRFNLHANNLGGLNVGSPVYFRRIPVGEVEQYALSQERSGIDLTVFVRAPHDARIKEQTKFWNISGFRADLSAEGISIETQSVVSMLVGGIAFETPRAFRDSPGGAAADDSGDSGASADGDAGQVAALPADHVFHLFRDRDQAFRPNYRQERSLIYFEDSVRGLSEGAPVEFRGMKVGEVISVDLQYDAMRQRFLIPVVIGLESERIEGSDPIAATERDRLLIAEHMIERGLRAQLRTGNLLTGQKIVALDFFPNAEPARLSQFNDMLVIPSVPAAADALMTSAADIVDNLAAVPFDEIGTELAATLGDLRTLLQTLDLQPSLEALERTLAEAETFAGALNAQTAPQLNAALREARSAADSAQAALSPDSTAYNELLRLLRELNAAARSLKVMADYLERNPDALVRGKR
ncbi:MAG: intermembrane transport protein PqiB, partial [Geminicoccaceae bacterium]